MMPQFLNPRTLLKFKFKFMASAASPSTEGASSSASAAPQSNRLPDEGEMYFTVKKWDCVVSWMFGRDGDQNLQDCAICKNALTEPSVTYETDPCETVRQRSFHCLLLLRRVLLGRPHCV